MKKLLSLLLGIFLLLFVVKGVYAQGRFSCEYNPGFGCVPSNSLNSCEAGYKDDPSLCASNSQADCNFQSYNCVGSLPPATEYCYACNPTLGGCTPAEPNDPTRCEYKSKSQNAAFNSCNAACTGKVATQYCCVQGQGCNECANGTTDLAACEASCSSANEVYCDGNTGINTAIGCIHALADSPEVFIGDILRWAVGIGGGIAFLLIVYASFMIMTSSGNPERLKAGQELLTSAIGGLILLVMSVFVLKFIGVDILGLCKFGFGTCG